MAVVVIESLVDCVARAAVGGWRRLKEDSRRLKCQKNGETGFGED